MTNFFAKNLCDEKMSMLKMKHVSFVIKFSFMKKKFACEKKIRRKFPIKKEKENYPEQNVW